MDFLLNFQEHLLRRFYFLLMEMLWDEGKVANINIFTNLMGRSICKNEKGDY